jgi:uncharacterized protein with von Willebrand factor type A (vWA) domain
MDEVIVPPGQLVPERVLHVEPNGGTDIDVAFERALTIIEQGKHNLRKADIVLITDGASHPARAKQLRERAKRQGVVSFGISIGAPEEDMLPWCDHVAAVTDMMEVDDDLATKMFGGV